MPEFTAFDRQTGQLLARGSAPTESACEAQAAGEHERILIGSFPEGCYMDWETMKPVLMGTKPGEHHVFDWVLHAWQDPRSMEDRRRNLRDRVTERRWTVETGGVTLAGGQRVLTGKPDQDRITAVIVNADIAGIDAVDFKADSGWARLSIDELRGVARAIGLHVQACFSAERTHHAAIDQLRTEAETEAYDISAGWPLTHNSIETQ